MIFSRRSTPPKPSRVSAGLPGGGSPAWCGASRASPGHGLPLGAVEPHAGGVALEQAAAQFLLQFAQRHQFGWRWLAMRSNSAGK